MINLLYYSCYISFTFNFCTTGVIIIANQKYVSYLIAFLSKNISPKLCHCLLIVHRGVLYPSNQPPFWDPLFVKVRILLCYRHFIMDFCKLRPIKSELWSGSLMITLTKRNLCWQFNPAEKIWNLHFTLTETLQVVFRSEILDPSFIIITILPL